MAYGKVELRVNVTNINKLDTFSKSLDKSIISLDKVSNSVKSLNFSAFDKIETYHNKLISFNEQVKKLAENQKIKFSVTGLNKLDKLEEYSKKIQNFSHIYEKLAHSMKSLSRDFKGFSSIDGILKRLDNLESKAKQTSDKLKNIGSGSNAGELGNKLDGLKDKFFGLNTASQLMADAFKKAFSILVAKLSESLQEFIKLDS